jgi:flagellar hook-basal body complex protein FliE
MTPLTAIPQMMSAFGTRPTAAADLMASVSGVIPPSELRPLSSPDGLSSISAPQPAGGADSFSSLLNQMVGGVTTRQAGAREAVRGLQGGQDVALHQAVIAMEEASISFQLMVQVRNKLLESYQELMRMSI